MDFSYWEIKNWFTHVDFTIVGSGIVGLNTALHLRQRFPESKILILEKGSLPQGASTKNAGFACFGSLSEIISDLNSGSEEQVLALIKKRWDGLQLLRKRFSDRTLDFKNYGGYELFDQNDSSLFDRCVDRIPEVNALLRPLFHRDVFEIKPDGFQFGNCKSQLIYNPFEAQIDSGNLMQALLKEAHSNNILILNSQIVTGYHEFPDKVQVELGDFSFKCSKLLFATNGFAQELTQNRVKPARAQVLITRPIPSLNIKGSFHIDEGFYYFRNIGDRILLGGGRNLDFETETTTKTGLTPIVQNKLDQLLKDVILPNHEFKVEHRWSGIMGMGDEKNPIVSQLSDRVYCGVRLGGMGIAIGSLIGRELAELV